MVAMMTGPPASPVVIRAGCVASTTLALVAGSRRSCGRATGPHRSPTTMMWAALTSLAACVGVALAAPRLGRLIRPDVATRLLAGVCVTTAGAVAWVIALAASTSVAQIPIVARAGDWSPRLLAEVDPVPRWLAIGCTAITAWALA